MLARFASAAGPFLRSAGELFWPPPVSPVFAEGGIFEGWNEDLVFIALLMMLFRLVDVLVFSRLLKPKSSWFALHAFANAIVVVAALPDLWRVIFSSTTAFTGPVCTMLVNSCVCAIHLYHVVFYSLNAADIFHHAAFVAVMGSMCVPFKQVSGASITSAVFFMSGLPGGINYVLLVLVKEGRMAPLSQKWFDAFINTWLRGPALAVYPFLLWQSWLAGTASWGGDNWLTNGSICMFITAGLTFFNGQHYCEMAVMNYAASLEKAKTGNLKAVGEKSD